MTDKEYIAERIHLKDGIEMSEELFKVKSEEYAEYLINKFGPETIKEVNGIFSNRAEYWQLKYVNE